MAREEVIKLTSEMLQDMQVLGRGNFSVIYKYGDKQVVKVLNESGMKSHDMERFNQLIKFDSDICVFPKESAEIDGKFQGYAMDYVDGAKIEDVIDGIDLEVLINAIKKAEISIEELSHRKLVFNDLNYGSIMWDKKNNCIKITDTDFFEVNQDIDVEQCFNSNMSLFNSVLVMDFGVMPEQEKRLSKFLNNDSQFSEVYRKYLMSSVKGEAFSIVDLLKTAKEVFEKEYGLTPQSLAEMRELVGEQENEIPDIPTFLPPNQQIGTLILGKQVLEEMSDVILTEETDRDMKLQEKSLQQKKESQEID